MDIARTLGEVVRDRRRELGLTQEELASRVSADRDYVRQSEISRLERGRVGLPRRDRLTRIAEALRLPLAELLARSGWAGAAAAFAPQSDPAVGREPESATSTEAETARPAATVAAPGPSPATTAPTFPTPRGARAVDELTRLIDQAEVERRRSAALLEAAAQVHADAEAATRARRARTGTAPTG
ncbi:MAG: hypothetical protein AVDCRST_MAG49-3287 [uncultured Thermomicrobiales bacterium]|uniref:HTH cro/C1-type domain-containing protein n=1 Tax=uncultured Thermomicrobiales bacterium TaxID=1645740 RepID=A0A6J4V354_9BACT|nr:MAG: hypothetical protein AVDCRST_MAG49-3287 [uncultured Thermomicrobiales bacterium]